MKTPENGTMNWRSFLVSNSRIFLPGYPLLSKNYLKEKMKIGEKLFILFTMKCIVVLIFMIFFAPTLSQADEAIYINDGELLAQMPWGWMDSTGVMSPDTRPDISRSTAMQIAQREAASLNIPQDAYVHCEKVGDHYIVSFFPADEVGDYYVRFIIDRFTGEVLQTLTTP